MSIDVPRLLRRITVYGVSGLIAIAVTMGASLQHQQRIDACQNLGGHYVAGTLFTPEECWSADGARRLFPWS